MPLSIKYLPAGEAFAMLPAGEMWSVVTESPNTAIARAPRTSASGAGCAPIASKKDGFFDVLALADSTHIARLPALEP